MPVPNLRGQQLRSDFAPHVARLIERQIIDGRRQAHGNTPCMCPACQAARALWPRHMVGSDERGRPGTWLSYECHLEMAARADEADTAGRTAEWACMQGLTIIAPPGPREAARYVAGCRLCGGLRRQGNRYCLKCWQGYIRPIEETTGRDALVWLNPEGTPAEWAAVRDAILERGGLE